jgi:ABC-type branched-subunit amino acid transport system ATPase component
LREIAVLLEADGITKAFGSFKAVDDASVAVEQGEVLGLIGPNGAGKSTFFNCLTGDLPPTRGTTSPERHPRPAPLGGSPAPSKCRSPSRT